MNSSNLIDINEFINPVGCEENDTKFFISVVVNVALLIFVGGSELMAISKCPSNGILDLLCKAVKNRESLSSDDKV